MFSKIKKEIYTEIKIASR